MDSIGNTMRYNTLSQFYTSQEWRSFRDLIIDERTNKADGILYDEYNGKPILKKYDIIVHHKTPLTMQNVNDVAIALNPENVMCVSMRSHNEIHARFGHCAQKKVYIVHGAPLSGKTSYVNEHKGNSDLIVDADNIWQCITGNDRYVKPNALKQNFFAVRDCLLDSVKRRVGNWETAWVISAEIYQTPFEELCNRLGGEIIEIDTDKETCLKRLYNEPNGRDLKLWGSLIEKYFEVRQ